MYHTRASDMLLNIFSDHHVIRRRLINIVYILVLDGQIPLTPQGHLSLSKGIAPKFEWTARSDPFTRSYRLALAIQDARIRLRFDSHVLFADVKDHRLLVLFEQVLILFEVDSPEVFWRNKLVDAFVVP